MKRMLIWIAVMAVAFLGFYKVFEPTPVVAADFTDEAIEQLKEDEGFSAVVYEDEFGFRTIGHGTLLPFTDADLICFDGVAPDEVTTDEGDCLLRTRLTQYVDEFKAQWTPFVEQSQNIKDALSNMVYNLGVDGLLQFDTMLPLIAEHMYREAADDALNTLWARELSERAHRIIQQIRSEEDTTVES